MGLGAQALQLLVHRARAVPAFRHRGRKLQLARDLARRARADRQARGRRLRAGPDRDGLGQAPHLPRARVSRHRVSAGGAGDARQSAARELTMAATPLWAQFINLLAAVLLLLAFAMLAQRRVLTLVDLFAAQGFALAGSPAIGAFATHQPHLYWSAGLTLALKVGLLPWLLLRMIRQLDVRWDVEGLINIPITMLIGIVLVVFAFNLAYPIAQLANTVTRATLGIAMASVMLSFLMMITRRKAIPQAIGFLSMENGLFFAATSATYGMPLVGELGMALDVLVGMLILGVFFFQIREQFDSLDLKHLERLKEDVAQDGAPEGDQGDGVNA